MVAGPPTQEAIPGLYHVDFQVLQAMWLLVRRNRCRESCQAA